MASTFKNYTARSIGTTATVVHTGPTATQTTVIGWSIANRTASIVRVCAILNDGTDTYLVGGPTASTMGVYLLPGSSVVVVGGDQKLVLEATDTLKVISDTASSADSIVSVLEIT